MIRSLRLLGVLTCIGFACLAAAKPPFLKVFFNLYKIKETSAIGKARCLNCHLPPGPPKRNPYGLAVQEALLTNHARMVTPEMLVSIEKKNMGEALTFGAKIKKDIPPGKALPKTKPTAKGKIKPAGKKHAMMIPNGIGAPIFMLGIAPLGLCLGQIKRRSK
jgi:hypothetical protein